MTGAAGSASAFHPPRGGTIRLRPRLDNRQFELLARLGRPSFRPISLIRKATDATRVTAEIVRKHPDRVGFTVHPSRRVAKLAVDTGCDAEITAQRDALLAARARAVGTIEFEQRRVSYATEACTAAAITELERPDRRGEGRRPAADCTDDGEQGPLTLDRLTRWRRRVGELVGGFEAGRPSIRC